VLTDNGSEFRAHELTDRLDQLEIQQRRIRADRPTSNGHVERLQLTILEECWRPAFARSLVPKLTALQRDLVDYLRYYNFDRAHTGRLTNGRVPAEIVYRANKMRATRRANVAASRGQDRLIAPGPWATTWASSAPRPRPNRRRQITSSNACTGRQRG
jgi:Integrase core domain